MPQPQLPSEALHGLPSAESGRRLQPIATLELDGERLDIAKNGGYHLVLITGPDAYGRPIAKELQIDHYLANSNGRVDVDRAQALLDALGEALVRLQGQRDLRLGGEGGAE